MKQHEVTVPQIGLIPGTRAMLGAGIALLLSEKLTDEQRRANRLDAGRGRCVNDDSTCAQLLSEDKWVATLPSFASARQFHGSVTDNGRKSGIATRDSVSLCARTKSRRRSWKSKRRFRARPL